MPLGRPRRMAGQAKATDGGSWPVCLTRTTGGKQPLACSLDAELHPAHGGTPFLHETELVTVRQPRVQRSPGYSNFPTKRSQRAWGRDVGVGGGRCSAPGNRPQVPDAAKPQASLPSWASCVFLRTAGLALSYQTPEKPNAPNHSVTVAATREASEGGVPRVWLGCAALGKSLHFSEPLSSSSVKLRELGRGFHESDQSTGPPTSPKNKGCAPATASGTQRHPPASETLGEVGPLGSVPGSGTLAFSLVSPHPQNQDSQPIT